MRNLMVLAALCLLSMTSARANDAVQTHVPSGQEVGSARLSLMFWDVYDVTLYAPHGKWSSGAPFALKLHYFLEIKGADIADRSVQEMRKQGFSDELKLAAWHTQMRDLFPDVSDGTELAAVFVPGEITNFYQNGRFIGNIHGADFSLQFFNIWLGEKTSEPELRQKLLGLI